MDVAKVRDKVASGREKAGQRKKVENVMEVKNQERRAREGTEGK